MASLGLFPGDEHKPFYLEGDQQAALLIHGFMGTPAEMRPLAHRLHQNGWTVQGILMPGFGSQIATLFDRSWQEWACAVATALSELQERHHPVFLIGYSLGAAVALNVAAKQPPDALALLAPFWRLGNTLHYIIWQVARRLFPNPRPFRRANFSNARIGEFIGGLIPGLKLDDPQVQESLRELRVPARFGEQIFAVGRSAGKAATHVRRPTLIIQGTQDQASKPGNSRQLLTRLAGPVTYEEFEADHELVKANNPGFNMMTRSVLAFAGKFGNGVGLPRS